MSLDIYLYDPILKTRTCVCTFCSNEYKEEYTGLLWHKNITHNLAMMASEAGIYQNLWHPETIPISYASEIEPHLQQAIITLAKDPEKFKRFNPENGWGSYHTLMKFIVEYHDACMKYPYAEIKICR